MLTADLALYMHRIKLVQAYILIGKALQQPSTRHMLVIGLACHTN